MKRYEPRIEDGIVFNGVQSRNIVLRERPEGMVVLFSDVQSLRAERDRLRVALVDIQALASDEDVAFEVTVDWVARIARRALEGDKG